MKGAFGFAVRPDLLVPPPLVDYPIAKYIWMGDEPGIKVVVIDFAQFLDAATMTTMKETLRYMPRSELNGLLVKQIQPLVAAEYYEIIKKSYINLFNIVNSAEAALRSISPWDWEKTKMRALYQSNADNLVDQNSLAFKLSTELLEEDATGKLIENLNTQYATLPKLGNLGAEASRQAAIIGLINQREYELVQKILNVYKAATPEENAKLSSLPANISTLASTYLSPLPENNDISNVLDQNPVSINTGPAAYIQPVLSNPLSIFLRR